MMHALVRLAINPFNWVIVLLFASALLYRKRRLSLFFLVVSIFWMWLWSSNATTRAMYAFVRSGVDFLDEEDAPVVDAIVDLGGGVGTQGVYGQFPELYAAADRTYQSARLYKSGRAKIIIPTGKGADSSDKKFMMALGVPEESIVTENCAANTADNARYTFEILENIFLKERESLIEGKKCRVLLVTSDWHMKRSLLMFEKYAKCIECIPVAGDFDLKIHCGRDSSIYDFLPNIGAMNNNIILIKEIVGYYGYKWFK